MKLKVSDLQLAMAYIEKEGTSYVDVTYPNTDVGVYFEFLDAENRLCEIKLYQSEMNTAPSLTKTMKLYTRFKKGEKK